MTTLAGALPKGDRNGLDAITRHLVDNPEQVHLVIALLDCKKVTRDTDAGESIPTARIRALEVMLAGDDTDAATRLLRRAFEQRTGQPAMLWDPETGALYLDAGDDDQGDEGE